MKNGSQGATPFAKNFYPSSFINHHGEREVTLLKDTDSFTQLFSSAFRPLMLRIHPVKESQPFVFLAHKKVGKE